MDNYVYGNGYEHLMEIKMTKQTKKQAKAIATATIYNTTLKTKAQMRAESEDAIAKFLKAGGTIQVAKPSRRKSTSKMTCKTSKGYQSGSAGFAIGFPRGSAGFSK